MAALPMKLVGRECVVDDDILAKAYQFVEIEKVILQETGYFRPEVRKWILEQYQRTQMIPVGVTAVKVREVGAIVEYSDGSVAIVSPVNRIRFIDD